jgi:hypothetical protein
MVAVILLTAFSSTRGGMLDYILDYHTYTRENVLCCQKLDNKRRGIYWIQGYPVIVLYRYFLGARRSNHGQWHNIKIVGTTGMVYRASKSRWIGIYCLIKMDLEYTNRFPVFSRRNFTFLFGAARSL